MNYWTKPSQNFLLMAGNIPGDSTGDFNVGSINTLNQPTLLLGKSVKFDKIALGYVIFHDYQAFFYTGVSN